MSARPILAVMLIGLPLSAQDAPQETQEVELREFRGRYEGVVIHRLEVVPNATLIMKALRGDIVLWGSDVHRIVIEEKITVRTRNRRRAKEAYEAAVGVLRPPTDKDGAYVFRVGKLSRRDVHYNYKVKLPKTFNLIVQSYGGDIDMTDLQGDLDAKTGGGDIALSKSGGRVNLRTGGGDINLFQVEGQVNVTTGGGDIEGRTVEGKLEAHTGGGDIEFWRCKGSLTLVTGGGDIELQGMEGAELEARTGGGDIDIANIVARVNLLTGGGDIAAQSVKGHIEVATSGGDVELHSIGGDAVLFSANGDITVNEIDGAVQARNSSGDISIWDMTLAQPGRDGSAFFTSYGDVTVNLRTEKPVAVSARLMGFSPRYALDRLSTNLDFNFRKDNSHTLATYNPDNSVHTITIETHGEIEIFQRED